jgi:two-component system phosphate regulon sensor histidine kinase PhoR
VVQRHGGQLRIESELGRGSRFMLSFPASRWLSA